MDAACFLMFFFVKDSFALTFQHTLFHKVFVLCVLCFKKETSILTSNTGYDRNGF